MQNSTVKQSICLLFRVHQPYRLKPYRFFDIGVDHSYFNQHQNADILGRIARDCYMPVNDVLMKLIRKFGSGFKIALSISGTAIEQMKKYVPEALESFRELYKTGNVELVAETYSHSLAMIMDIAEYRRQVEKQVKMLHCFFGCTPDALINSNFIHSNELASLALGMGFKVVLVDEAKKVAGLRDYNLSQDSKPYPELKIALRNNELSEDISSRFSSREWTEWPLTPDKYVGWLNGLEQSTTPVNLFTDYETFAGYKNMNTGILNFLQTFAGRIVASRRWLFSTVSEAAEKVLTVVKPDSLNRDKVTGDDRVLFSWIGNDLQQEALNGLYSALPVMATCTDISLRNDWSKLQSSDHFYYMCLEQSHNGGMNTSFSPYNSPYDAFINYMNVLSDFLIRVNKYENDHIYFEQCRL
ncbi:MAG: glycoside hydrolase family 57 protein [Lentimicrobiaceae bacterium]